MLLEKKFDRVMKKIFIIPYFTRLNQIMCSFVTQVNVFNTTLKFHRRKDIPSEIYAIGDRDAMSIL